MRKEYLPAIILYVASAVFYVAAAIMLLTHNHHWATVLLFGIITMLFASSRLVKIGKKLREEEKEEEK